MVIRVAMSGRAFASAVCCRRVASCLRIRPADGGVLPVLSENAALAAVARWPQAEDGYPVRRACARQHVCFARSCLLRARSRALPRYGTPMPGRNALLPGASFAV